jgi:hypothetical protein
MLPITKNKQFFLFMFFIILHAPPQINMSWFFYISIFKYCISFPQRRVEPLLHVLNHIGYCLNSICLSFLRSSCKYFLDSGSYCFKKLLISYSVFVLLRFTASKAYENQPSFIYKLPLFAIFLFVLVTFSYAFRCEHINVRKK